MHKYRLVAKKGEGTFSEVLKAQSIKNGKYVAIKCMKNHFDSLDQVNNLREIQALRRLSPHPNIIKLLEVLYDQPTGRLALVFELMDMNIYELIRGRRHYVAEERVKNYMYQLMKSMDHMHRNGIFHRDIKPENILIMDDCLKLADFGSCRGIYSKQPYTEYISTRWYRAPECLLTDGYYNYKMDMWGVGCVFFEIVSLFPLFPGTNELDQIQKIHNILGTPPPELLAKMKKRSQHMDFNFPPKEGTGVAKLIPHVNPECTDLIVKLLAYNPDDRLSARQALRHPYFRDLREAEKRQKALATPDLSTHFVAMEADKSSRQQVHNNTVSSNGSELDAANPSSPPEAGTATAPLSSLRQPSDATGAMGLPSIGGPKAMGGPTAAAQQAASQTAQMQQQQAIQLQVQHQMAAQAELSTHGLHHAHHHDDGSGSITDSTYSRLPGLLAQASFASVGDGDAESSLPPIGHLSLAKQQGVGGTGGGAHQHTSRRATLNYHDGFVPGKKSVVAMAPSVTGGQGGAGGTGGGSNLGGTGGVGHTRRQSLSTVQAGQPGKYSNANGVVGGGVGSTASMPSMPGVGQKPSQLPQALHTGAGMGALGAQGRSSVAPIGVGAEGQAGAGQMASFKYKANAKANSKYISPYSLRQLAGQQGGAQ